MLSNSWRHALHVETSVPFKRFASRGRAAQGHWSVPGNRRAFLEEFAATNGIQTLADWSRASQRDIIAAGGAGLLHRFGNSLSALLQDVYPSPSIAMGRRRPRGYWAAPDNRRAFLEQVAHTCQLSSPDDWRALTQCKVREAGGHGLLSFFKGSMTNMIVDSFPEMEEALAARRHRHPRGHWLARATRRQFLLQVAEGMGLDTSSAQGWHGLTSTAVRDAGGGGLLAAYRGSLHAALADTFPGMGMDDPASCRQVMPRGHWDDTEATLNRAAAFVCLAAERLSLKSPDDWYRASTAQMREVPGCAVLRKVSLIDALTHAFPEVRWEADRLGSRTKRSAQRGLRSCLQLLLVASQPPIGPQQPGM